MLPPATWPTPDVSTLSTALTAAELEALRGMDHADGGLADTAEDVIADVVAFIRGHVGSDDGNQLGPAGTLPPELMTAFRALIRQELASRLPTLGVVMDDVRKNALTRAEETLKQVREGKLKVSAPANAGSTAAPTRAAAGGEPRMDWGTAPSVAPWTAETTVTAEEE